MKVFERTYHKGMLVNDSGEISALCFNPPRPLNPITEMHIHAPSLYSEINCVKCRELLGLEDEPSRRDILLNNIAFRLNIFQMFTDTDYWNREVREAGEQKINPDPDGEAASMFIQFTHDFNEMMKPIEAVMKHHEKRYGWADEIKDEGK
jgi:hypothetical protein